MVLPTIEDIDGNPLTPSLTGKVLFVINVASQCGYTAAGYELLRKLTAHFDPSVFAAVAIPCNSFGMQEPGEPNQIKSFAAQRVSGIYLTEKSGVNGVDTHPLVAIGKMKFPEKVTWNFEGRYVFNKDGTPVARFTNASSDDDIIAEIRRYI